MPIKDRPIEPDNARVAQLGPETLPHLENLMDAGGIMLATKAVALASMTSDERSVRLLIETAASPRPELRVAAAAGTGNLAAEDADTVLQAALGDADSGVRKVTLRSVQASRRSDGSEGGVSGPSAGDRAVQAKVAELATSDLEPFIRDRALEVLRPGL